MGFQMLQHCILEALVIMISVFAAAQSLKVAIKMEARHHLILLL